MVIKMDLTKFKWTREPESCKISHDTIEVVTRPHTDLWQRTYYHFQNDNAPVITDSTSVVLLCTWTVKTG